MTLSRREFRLCLQIGTSSRNTQMKVAFLGRCLPQWPSPAWGRGDGGRLPLRKSGPTARLVLNPDTEEGKGGTTGRKDGASR